MAILVGSSNISFCDLNRVLATVMNNSTLENKKKNCLVQWITTISSSEYYFFLSATYFAKQDSSDSLLVVKPSITLKLLNTMGSTEKKMTTPKVGIKPATICFKILFFSASFSSQGKYALSDLVEVSAER